MPWLVIVVIKNHGFEMLSGSSCLVMEDGQKSLFDWIEERKEEEDQPFSPDIIEKVIR